MRGESTMTQNNDLQAMRAIRNAVKFRHKLTDVMKWLDDHIMAGESIAPADAKEIADDIRKTLA